MECGLLSILIIIAWVIWEIYSSIKFSLYKLDEVKEEEFLKRIEAIDKLTEKKKYPYAILHLTRLEKKAAYDKAKKYSQAYFERLMIIYIRMATNYKYKEDYQKAIGYYEKSLDLMKRMPVVLTSRRQNDVQVNLWLEIADCYMIMGNYDASISYLLKHQPEPYHRGFEFYLAQCYEKKGDIAEAIKYYEIEARNLEKGYSYCSSETPEERKERLILIFNNLKTLRKKLK